MKTQVKIIQDISLLYELSLSVGSTLDPQDNCLQFLRTLIQRKSLSFGSVWLYDKTSTRPETSCRIFYTYPNFRRTTSAVVCPTFIRDELSSKPYFSLKSQTPHFGNTFQEKKIKDGSFAIFRLGDLGFLKLCATNRPDGFSILEMEQLKQVVDKLKVSLEGCFAHIQLKEETENRLTAQKALEESENKLRRIIDSSLDAVVSADEAGMAIEWNAQAEKMFGYTRHEVLGNRLLDMFIPERHWHSFQTSFEEYLRTSDEHQISRRFETKCIRKDNTEFLAELSINVDINKKNVLYVGFVRDITEQRKAEKELEQAHIRMETLISNLQSGILLEGKDNKIALANQAFCNLFSFAITPDSLIGLDGGLVVEQSKNLFTDPEAFSRGIEQAEKNKVLITNDVVTMTNGKVLERDYMPLASGHEQLGHLWQYHDITERQNTEQAIRENEEKYRDVLQNMDLGLLEVDLEDNILRANNAFCRILGYTPEELIGKNAGNTFLSPSSRKIIDDRLKERKENLSSVYELQMKRKDGTLIWGLISGAPTKNTQGQVNGSIGIQFDLTDRKKLETELAEAKQVAERARLAERQFLTHMSHEIRTPINAVIGMTHLLDTTYPDETQRDYLNSLRFSADSLLGIVDNILDLSKIDAGEIEFEKKPFDLNYLLKSLMQSIQYKKDPNTLAILEKIDPDVENLVIGDPTRLNQILTNLLGNALKFTKKGEIALQTTVLSKTELEYHIEFRVHDTGIGIPEDKHETIFEYFKQADVQTNRIFGGTGLGLTIVKQLVEMMDGSIRVESKLGIGSDFIFVLSFGNSGIPFAGMNAPGVLDGQQNKHLLKGLHFLIVEDNLLNQKLICKTIETWECSFELARNGREALEKTAKSLFDLILMDFHMPELDGCEATWAIRNDLQNPNRNVPIIALTAAAMLDDKKRAFEAGMNSFLTKPISPKNLQEHILRAILEFGRKDGSDTVNVIHPASKIVSTVDLGYLLNLSNGDILFVTEIIESFLTETPNYLKALQVVAQKQEWDQCYFIVHRLKPNFDMFGMKLLADKSAFLEEYFKKGSLAVDQLSELITQLIEGANLALPLLAQEKKALLL